MPLLDPSRMPWGAIPVFLALCRSGSVRAAAASLSLSHPTVLKHLDNLESSLGILVFTRNPEGLLLTPDGLQLKEVAEEMEIAASGVRAIETTASALRPIILAVTDTIAHYWLVDKLPGWLETSGNPPVFLSTTMAPVDLARREAEIYIHMDAPVIADAVTIPVAYANLSLYASPKYIAAKGMPRELSDLPNHRFILYSGPQIPDAYAPVIAAFPEFAKLACVQTESPMVACAAVISGAGIGGLPSYVAVTAPGLVQIPLPLASQQPIFLTYHSKNRSNPRLRSFITWLRLQFDDMAHPFLGKDFHPEDMAAYLSPAPASNGPMAPRPDAIIAESLPSAS